MLKAYSVFPCEKPDICGCLLVFAPTRNKARMFAMDEFYGVDYIGINAWRFKDFDKWCVKDEIYSVNTNNELPEGAPDFYIDEAI